MPAAIVIGTARRVSSRSGQPLSTGENVPSAAISAASSASCETSYTFISSVNSPSPGSKCDQSVPWKRASALAPGARTRLSHCQPPQTSYSMPLKAAKNSLVMRKTVLSVKLVTRQVSKVKSSTARYCRASKRSASLSQTTSVFCASASIVSR